MNDNTAPIDPYDNVADSTDWLSTPLPGLAPVEAGLRCQVCKDFFKTPMLTSCNHTFCSTCIRRALSNEGKCPLCRAPEQEVKLRSNWSMEEVVAAFTQTRAAVLEFAQRPAIHTTESPKRKIDGIEEDEEEEGSSSQRSSKRLRSSARLSKSRGMEATAEMARREAHIIDPEPTNFEPDDGLVACPICWQRMKAVRVDKHLDTNCPGEPQPNPPQPRETPRSTGIPNAFASCSSSTSFSKPSPRPLDRLPALHYSMLKEAQLRKKLAELGISTGGNRQMLEKRHMEWMTIWNANCDSLHPRRKAELLHDLDSWERTQGTRAPTSSRSLNLGAQIKDKDFDGAAWAAKHDTSFKDLIASARKNRGQGQKAAESNGNDDGMGGGESETPTAEGLAETTRLPPQATPIANAFIDLTGDTALTSPPKQFSGENGTVDLELPDSTVMS